jgi:4-hydroxy-tetrahydrodipicolinate synthase
MQSGVFTAIVTPFSDTGIDYEGLERLIDFQMQNNITGILAVGTTGESPTLNWDEHNRIIRKIAEKTRGKCKCIAGVGSNNTAETLFATRHAADAGVDAVLLVDPYYNGPSSLEIRKEYVEPVARAFPSLPIIPYVIPGRTGAQLLPEDLAILAQQFDNVGCVKEATGDPANMRRTRQCCGDAYIILSGDDGLTFQIMTDPEIRAAGAISVMSNVAPKAVAEMVDLINRGDTAEAKNRADALEPLFGLVTVKTRETTPYGEVVCRARNPLAVKTIMQILGMPAGGCRRPLGKMTGTGLEHVLKTLRQVHADHPEILQPAAEFFNVDIGKRINSVDQWADLVYSAY